MPHLILEHSVEIASDCDLSAVVQDLFNVALESGVFGAGKDIKTRTLACENVVMGARPQTFAHLTLRLVAGRPVDVRAKLAKDLLAVLERHMPNVGSLSVIPVELDPEVYVKRVL